MTHTQTKKTIKISQDELILLRDAISNHIVDRKFPRDCSKDHNDLLIKNADYSVVEKLLPLRDLLTKKINS